MVAFAVGPEVASEIRSASLLAGIVFGAWLAYFGGFDRFRTTLGSEPSAQ